MSGDDTLEPQENTLEAQAEARKKINLRKRSRGRPKKKEISAKSKGGRGVRGRPKGDAAIINEYKARMLASPKSVKVLETIFEAALDHDHKNQAAAWKLVMDRILPVGAFEKEVTKDGGRSAIQINITGVGGATVDSSYPESSTIEGELVD
jgi:hypothetical protein